MTRGRIITLLTDFGLADAYVGIMKGVVLGITPEVTAVDISHLVPPQDVSSAAFLLLTAYRYFPEDAIHLAVVDPGVGTSRRAVALGTEHGLFVGPDNGIFSDVLLDQGAVENDGQLGPDVEAVELANESFRLHPVSSTFHGRDVFAPAAAHLARGVRLQQLGPRLESLRLLAVPAPVRRGGALEGAIRYIDRFGNAISNISRHDLPPEAWVEAGGRRFQGFSTSYQEGDLVAIMGSAGFLELAVRNGSAADVLGLRVGDPVTVRSG
jgi:S-adenosylmethionine hydrolase